jgi:hypothetical protein
VTRLVSTLIVPSESAELVVSPEVVEVVVGADTV